MLGWNVLLHDAYTAFLLNNMLTIWNHHHLNSIIKIRLPPTDLLTDLHFFVAWDKFFTSVFDTGRYVELIFEFLRFRLNLPRTCSKINLTYRVSLESTKTLSIRQSQKDEFPLWLARNEQRFVDSSNTRLHTILTPEERSVYIISLYFVYYSPGVQQPVYSSMSK